MKWYPIINDVVGGYAVSNLDEPVSEHDLRKEGNPEKRGYVIADFMTEDDAKVVAHLLNIIDYQPIALGIKGSGWWSDAKVQIDEGLSA